MAPPDKEELLAGLIFIRSHSYYFSIFLIFAKTKPYNMKKEFGKWLMDIAKYLMTVAILSSIITDMDKTWLYYLSLLFFIVLILVFGLWLIRDKKEGV